MTELRDALVLVLFLGGVPMPGIGAPPAEDATLEAQVAPHELQIPTSYRTPLEKKYGHRIVTVSPGTHLNVIDISPDKHRALVFIHGDAGSFDYWKPQVEFFKDAYRIVLYERADCGRSSAPDGLTYSTSANNLGRLLEILGVTRYALVGHSRGQEIGALLVSRNPPGLVGFVAEGTAIWPHPSDESLAEARSRVDRHRLGEIDLRVEVLRELSRYENVIGSALDLEIHEAWDLLRYACSRWRPAPGILGGTDVDFEEELREVNIPMLQIDGAAYRRDKDRRIAMQKTLKSAGSNTASGSSIALRATSAMYSFASTPESFADSTMV